MEQKLFCELEEGQTFTTPYNPGEVYEKVPLECSDTVNVKSVKDGRKYFFRRFDLTIPAKM